MTTTLSISHSLLRCYSRCKCIGHNFGEFFEGDVEGYVIFSKAPLAAAEGRHVTYVLTTTIGQRASIQCLYRPIENALGLVNLG